MCKQVVPMKFQDQHEVIPGYFSSFPQDFHNEIRGLGKRLDTLDNRLRDQDEKIERIEVVLEKIQDQREVIPGYFSSFAQEIRDEIRALGEKVDNRLRVQDEKIEKIETLCAGMQKEMRVSIYL